jgi:hypothetical protein
MVKARPATNVHVTTLAEKGKRRRTRLLGGFRSLVMLVSWILVSARNDVNRDRNPCPECGSCHHLVVPQ